MQNSVKVLLSCRKNTFQDFLRGLTSISVQSNENSINLSIDRKRYLYNMVNRCSFNVNKGSYMGLPLMSSTNFHSPLRPKRRALCVDNLRCFSSVTSGDGNDDSGDSPEDVSPGKSIEKF